MTEYFTSNKYEQCSCKRYVLMAVTWDEETKSSTKTCPKCGVVKTKLHDYVKFENGKRVEFRDSGKIYHQN